MYQEIKKTLCVDITTFTDIDFPRNCVVIAYFTFSTKIYKTQKLKPFFLVKKNKLNLINVLEYWNMSLVILFPKVYKPTNKLVFPEKFLKRPSKTINVSYFGHLGIHILPA